LARVVDCPWRLRADSPCNGRPVGWPSPMVSLVAVKDVLAW